MHICGVYSIWDDIIYLTVLRTSEITYLNIIFRSFGFGAILFSNDVFWELLWCRWFCNKYSCCTLELSRHLLRSHRPLWRREVMISRKKLQGNISKMSAYTACYKVEYQREVIRYLKTQSWLVSNLVCTDGLVQDCSISIVNALETLQSCTKKSICKTGIWKSKISILIIEWSPLPPSPAIQFSLIVWNCIAAVKSSKYFHYDKKKMADSSVVVIAALTVLSYVSD